MSPLGILNFIVLQWFGVRLCVGYDFRLVEWERNPEQRVPYQEHWIPKQPRGRWWSKYAPPHNVKVSWSLLRWIWPLTGWWSADYRWIRKAKS